MLEGLQSYLAAIGLPASDLRGMIERLGELAKKGQSTGLPDGGALVTWRDVCGAALSIYVDASEAILGALPYFASARPGTVLVREIEPDDDFRFYDRVALTTLPPEGASGFELTAMAHDIATSRDRIHPGMPMSVALSALADTWSRVDGENDSPGLSALAAEDGLPAHARHAVVGRVLRADEPLNRHSRVAFQHARLDVGGFVLDALMPERDDDEGSGLQKGELVKGRFLFVATLDAAPLDATVAKIRL